MISATIFAALVATSSAARSPYIYGADINLEDMETDDSFTRTLQMTSDFDFPEPSETVNLTRPISVFGGKVFDGKGRRFQMMTPDTPMFRVFNGTVQNLVVGDQIGDGVRCFGDCDIYDVFFEDVGLGNAISLSSTTKDIAVVNIGGGGARDADDVAISLNSGANVTITDYVFDSCRTGIHVSETFKRVGRDADVLIIDSVARYTNVTERLALVKKPISGLPAMMEITNVTIVDKGNKKVCEGPRGACNVSGIKKVRGNMFTEEDDN